MSSPLRKGYGVDELRYENNFRCPVCRLTGPLYIDLTVTAALACLPASVTRVAFTESGRFMAVEDQQVVNNWKGPAFTPFSRSKAAKCSPWRIAPACTTLHATFCQAGRRPPPQQPHPTCPRPLAPICPRAHLLPSFQLPPLCITSLQRRSLFPISLSLEQWSHSRVANPVEGFRRSGVFLKVWNKNLFSIGFVTGGQA